MARFCAAWRTAGAGSATLPMASLYGVTTTRATLVEVGVANTTAIAVNVGLIRLTTTGTQGSTITSTYEDDDSQTALATAKDTHTVAPTMTNRLRVYPLAGVIGSGVIWPFGTGRRTGLTIPNLTTAGIGIYVPSGSGQICDVWFVWDE